jgi:probable HAF family extracellular repeat protein
MLYLRKWQLAFVCLLALALLPFAPAPRGTAQAPGYTVTDLGTLGGDASRAFGLDECGNVVGDSQAAAGASAPSRPFLWKSGVMTDLGTLGGQAGTAYAINDSGVVTGSARNSGQTLRAFRWIDANGNGASDPGEMIELGTLGGPTVEAYDINASQQIVGVSELSAVTVDDRAFVWQPGVGMRMLTAPWGTPIRAFGINDAGQIAGTATHSASGTHAFVTVGGVALDLGTLGGAVSFATEVNDVGEVAGYSYIFSNTITQSFHAFRWKDANTNGQSDAGEMQDLGTLGGRHSYAYDINDSGLVVGRSEITAGSSATRAFIWSSTGGLQDLNNVVPGTGWTFQEAHAINDRGQIVGFGLNPDGKVRGFLLTPTDVGPSPCAGTLQFGSPTYGVGEGGPTATITVTRTGGSDGAVSVGYSASDGTATAGSDYTAASGTLNFAAGDTSETFTVPISDDTLDETDETVNLSLSNPTGTTLGAQSTAVLTITDNDAAPTLSVNDVPVTEGNAGTQNVTFNVTLSAASGQTVFVNYSTAPNTAVAPGDYTSTSGTLTFNPGDTSETFTVAVVGDTLDEANETFNVNLSDPINATVSDGTGVGTINDDDGAPALSINDVTVAEGDAGTTAATFTVSLLPASGQAVSVNYATANATAAAPGDFAAVNSTQLTFDPGQTSKTVTVNVNGDTTPEAHETFNVTLSGASNATISDNTGVGTINNDDAALSVNDRTLAEGVSGNTTFTFTVSITHPTVNAVSVGYATSDGTATTANNDYTATSGTVNIPAGSTTATFDVQVTGDTTLEANETFNVNLSSPTNATVADGTGVGTITNDDAAPNFSVNDVSVAEGNAGTVTATFTVTLSAASGLASSVNYATADNTATQPADYTSASGTLNFAAGETSKTVNVTVKGDTLFEGNESFFLNLTSASNAGLADAQGVGTILDDDEAPVVRFKQSSFNVGEGAGTATVTVTRSGGTNGGVSVSYSTGDGTATQPGDYTPASGTVTFAEGETEKTFNVTVNQDTTDEPDETVNLALGTPGGGATLGAQSTAVLTITDDDAAPTVSVNDVTVTEGDAGTTNATFTVTLSAASALAATVNVNTSDGTAAAGTDYTALPNTTLTFNPGETSKTVNVSVLGDTTDEPNKTFNVNLSDPTNATVSDGTGVGTINDDDGAPALSINDVTVAEGDAGTTAATFTVSLLPASGQAVSVNYATADGTATAGPDYVGASGTLNFAAGETTKTVTVNVNGDTANEAHETFFVNLSGATNATAADAQGQGTITNDDTPALRFSQAAYPVGESAHFVTVTVTRTGDLAGAVGVSFATSDGTASERRDYTAASGRLQFAAGETSKTFDVLLTEDAYTESEETINLTLSNPTGGAALGTQPTATVNIAADDNPPPGFNPIDISSDFVRQHYHDFLNREPDAEGLAFWVGDIEQCGSDAQCREVKRINVSAAFFLSIEFQQTGYLVYRTYKAAYGDATSPGVEGTVPVVRLQEFLPDTRIIGDGVVVGQPNWEQKLEANKNAYMAEFVQRPRFLTAFPLSMTAAEFVDKLNQNAGGVLTQAERDQLVSDLATNAKTRAQVLRAVTENAQLQQAEFRRAFVLMQYYGYLRRNPDDPQDTDFRGWKFWLTKLNEANGNFVQAEMVKAFLDSIEYRTRFAP